MKNNIKNFLKEKKDLLIFVGVLVVTFIGVIGLASLTTKDNSDQAGGGIDDSKPPVTETPEPTPVIPETFTFSLPVKGEYVVAREFFDISNKETITLSVMTNGTNYVASRGLGFKMADNSVFDVYSVYPGIVKEVITPTNTLEGITVKIEHEDGVYSVYKSLSSVTVKENDMISEGSKIGVAGTTITDLEAGIHVHLELIQDGIYLNPKDAFGKQISELASVGK